MRGNRVVQVVALTGLIPLVAAWLGAAPAEAATPQVTHTKIRVSFIGIPVCGFTVDSVVKGTDTFKVFFDQSGNVSSMQDESHAVSTLTNEANGKVVYVEQSGRDRFSPPAVNPDGTVTFTDTLTGMDIRIYTSHSNTLVKDAGLLSFADTFDSQGNFLSEQVVEHGQHPFGGDSTVMCDAIASAIG